MHPIADTVKIEIAVPRSKDEANTLLARLGETRRAKARVEAMLTEQLAAARRHFEGQLQAYAGEEEGLTRALCQWASDNEGELTMHGKRRRVLLTAGIIAWRKGKAKVETVGDESKIIATLKNLKLGHLVRLKETLDKQAILKDPAAVRFVPGLSITAAEDEIVIEPHHAEAS